MAGPCVLLIDDSELLLEVVKAGLAKRGIEAVTQSSPFGIDRIVEQRRPGLVVLDVEMPLVGGAELCRLLKAHPSTRHLPVVFYSRLPEADLARLVTENAQPRTSGRRRTWRIWRIRSRRS